MNKDFFKKTRILDGGMGQELLNKGLKPKGTLWSAHALIDSEYHQMIIDTHLDFINAGAEVIVTTTFTARKLRLRENNCEKYFENINIKAVELAKKARDISKKNVLIAAGLPNQKQTYDSYLGEDLNLIEQNFYEQAKLLSNGVDFIYLDVMGSGLECEIALRSIENFDLPVLVGIHLKDNGLLPSKEKIEDVINKYKSKKWLGVIMACISPSAYEIVINSLKKINFPYGFKLNAFQHIPEGYTVADKDAWGDAGNPTTILGINKDLNEDNFYNYAKKFMENGATILGGCCEIRPSHIKKISQLKNL